jgi:hypothetical protein
VALVDHSAAWLDLVKLIESRDGWGSKQLLAEMSKLEAKHRVSEGLIERVLRLYGVQLADAVNQSIPEAPANGRSGTTPTAPEPVTGQSKTEEVTNGSEQEGLRTR